MQLNGDRIKASRHVKVGDRLRINRERELFEIDVTGIPRRRGPGGRGQTALPGNAGKRGRAGARSRTEPAFGAGVDGRPDKRERRDLMRWSCRGDEDRTRSPRRMTRTAIHCHMDDEASADAD